MWSHHTLKADALLGRASLDLSQALEQHDRKRTVHSVSYNNHRSNQAQHKRRVLCCFWTVLSGCGSTVENVKEVLKLSVEQKGALVSAGELTVYLDGLTAGCQDDLAPLTNGDAANGNGECFSSPDEAFSDIVPSARLHLTPMVAPVSEVQQNGDGFHENGDSSPSKAASR